MDVTFDENGDIDRQGFLVEVVDGKQVIKQVLPKLEVSDLRDRSASRPARAGPGFRSTLRAA